MTARVFTADEALRGGLVRSVHPPDELLPAAQALASEIATNAAPISVALTRQMMWRMLGADDPMEAHKIDSRGVYSTGRSPDAFEGVTAFLQKRHRGLGDETQHRHARVVPVVDRADIRVEPPEPDPSASNALVPVVPADRAGHPRRRPWSSRPRAPSSAWCSSPSTAWPTWSARWAPIPRPSPRRASPAWPSPRAGLPSAWPSPRNGVCSAVWTRRPRSWGPR